MNTHPSQPGEQKPEPLEVTLARIEGVLQGHSFYCRTGMVSPELAQGTMTALQVDLPNALASHAQSQARIASLEGALREIARQTPASELSEEDAAEADFEGAYDSCIETARLALNHPPQ